MSKLAIRRVTVKDMIPPGWIIANQISNIKQALYPEQFGCSELFSVKSQTDTLAIVAG